MVQKASYDPLSCIPSSGVIRKRLTETRELARRLSVLLRTAERIERQREPVREREGSRAR
jgi:hypothetical protein